MNDKVEMSQGKRHLLSDSSIIRTIKNRFYDKVLLPNENGCMEWISCINYLGYGQFYVNGVPIYSHRFSFHLHTGINPKGYSVLHKCDNRKCVAPYHLFLGTQADNVKDMINKGRKACYNGEKSSNVKLTENDVRNIKIKLMNKEKHSKIAEEFKVDKTTITAINLGKNWKHIKI